MSAVVDEDKLMILPPSAIRFAASWQQKNAPFTFTAKRRSNSSSPTSTTGLVNITPALFTRMSSLPNFSKQASNRRRTSGPGIIALESETEGDRWPSNRPRRPML